MTTAPTPTILGSFEIEREDDGSFEGRLTDLGGDLGGAVKDYVEQLAETIENAVDEGDVERESNAKSLWNTVRAYLCMLTLSKVDGEWEGLKMQVPDPVHGTVEGHACDVTPEGFNLRNDNDGGGGDGGDDDDEDDDVDDDDECMTAEEMDGMCSSHWNDTVLMDDELGAAKDIVDEHVDDLAKLREDGVFVDAGLDELAYDETILAACVREYEMYPDPKKPLIAWQRDPANRDTLNAVVQTDWLRRVELVFKEELEKRSGTHAPGGAEHEAAKAGWDAMNDEAAAAPAVKARAEQRAKRKAERKAARAARADAPAREAKKAKTA